MPMPKRSTDAKEAWDSHLPGSHIVANPFRMRGDDVPEDRQQAILAIGDPLKQVLWESKSFKTGL